MMGRKRTGERESWTKWDWVVYDRGEREVGVKFKPDGNAGTCLVLKSVWSCFPHVRKPILFIVVKKNLRFNPLWPSPPLVLCHNGMPPQYRRRYKPLIPSTLSHPGLVVKQRVHSWYEQERDSFEALICRPHAAQRQAPNGPVRHSVKCIYLARLTKSLFQVVTYINFDITFAFHLSQDISGQCSFSLKVQCSRFYLDIESFLGSD